MFDSCTLDKSDASDADDDGWKSDKYPFVVMCMKKATVGLAVVVLVRSRRTLSTHAWDMNLNPLRTLACPAGRRATEQGATECDGCSPGFFSGEGASVCLGCEPGSFSSSQNQTACELCEVGRYPLTNSTACQYCGEQNSSDKAGAERWTTVALQEFMGEWYWVDLEGAPNESACSCGDGYRGYQGDSVACGEGMVCDGKDVTSEPGYFAPSDDVGVVWRCHGASEKRCLGGAPGFCQSQTYSTNDGPCKPCIASDEGLLALAATVIFHSISEYTTSRLFNKVNTSGPASERSCHGVTTGVNSESDVLLLFVS